MHTPTAVSTVASSSTRLSTDDARSMYGSFINYLHSIFDGMNIHELMAERDGLTSTHIAKLYTVDFKRDVLGGKNILDTDTWSDVKKSVSNPATLESIRQYINKRIIEEKRQPASPASSSGKKGKGLTRVITKDKAKPKAKSRATKKKIVYLQQPVSYTHLTLPTKA